MIRAFYGIDTHPFSCRQPLMLLPHQKEVFDILKVHCHQGGLCLLTGRPGTGKTSIKNAIIHHQPKTVMVVNVSRSLHTYLNIVKILCRSFSIDHTGSVFKCEKRLIEQAYNQPRDSRMWVALNKCQRGRLNPAPFFIPDFPTKNTISAQSILPITSYRSDKSVLIRQNSKNTPISYDR